MAFVGRGSLGLQVFLEAFGRVRNGAYCLKVFSFQVALPLLKRAVFLGFLLSPPIDVF